MEWLQAILGETYTSDIAAAIEKQIAESYVPKSELEARDEESMQLKTQLQTLEGQLDGLKTEGGGMTEKINALQEQNRKDKETYETEIARIRLDSAVDKALLHAGSKNNVATKALLADFIKDAKITKDGQVKGLSEAIDGLIKTENTSFLFKTADTSAPPQIKGMKPGESNDTSGITGNDNTDPFLAGFDRQ